MHSGVPLLNLDGSHLPQGGVILHTSLMVSCLTKQNIRIQKIRGHEHKPGLTIEDLTIIKLLASSTKAEVTGNQIGSSEIFFKPTQTPKPLNDELRMQDSTKDKGHGNIASILSIVLPILARTWGYSQLAIMGDTHTIHDFHYDFFEYLVLALYQKQGIYAFPNLRSSNFNKKSVGEVFVEIEPSAFLPLNWQKKGALKFIKIILSESNISAIVQKSIIDQLDDLLKPYTIEPLVQIIPLNSKDIGFSLTLLAEFENGLGGFSICQDKPEQVKQSVYSLYKEFKEWIDSQTTLSPNLLPYVLIPMVFSKESNEIEGKTILTTPYLNSEAKAIIWTLKQLIPLKLMVTNTSEKYIALSYQQL